MDAVAGGSQQRQKNKDLMKATPSGLSGNRFVVRGELSTVFAHRSNSQAARRQWVFSALSGLSFAASNERSSTGVPNQEQLVIIRRHGREMSGDHLPTVCSLDEHDSHS